jgi:2Fe-2S ferredoxin
MTGDATATMAATVRVEPAGVELDVEAGETVLEAAWRLGYTWPTTCFGQAECMVCFVKVIGGEQHTEPPGSDELFQMGALLPRRLRGPLVRLACRLRVTGSGVILEKKGVRTPEGS